MHPTMLQTTSGRIGTNAPAPLTNGNLALSSIAPKHRSSEPDVLVGAARTLLSQCEIFVARLDNDTFSAPSRVLAGGTIGKHLRHLLDHFTAISHALKSRSPIDYDHRERDVPMEANRLAALRALQQSIETLSNSSDTHEPHCASSPVRVRIMIDGSGTEIELGSTLGRELAFATHHAVHHCAMMRAIALEHGVSEGICGQAFGLAPSTANHRSH